MRTLQLTLLALGTFVLACSGEGIQTEPEGNPGTGGQTGGGDTGGTDGDPTTPTGGNTSCGGYPDYPCGTGAVTGTGAITSTGGMATGGGHATGGGYNGGGGLYVGGLPNTGGTGGDVGGYPGETGGMAGTGTGGAAELINYFDPAPPQPTEFSCCVIWAHCTHHAADYRCTEATLVVTNSNRDDACDIWLQQVQDPIGAESIPYCL
jgi:hypothetical protein